jgi:hypothetical protein
VVLWQNAHLAVFWDLSYILDSSFRIALGQVPYRDFPLAHAPLTFLIQAAIMRLTGRVYFHHVLYAAVVGGLGTVLAWRIALHILQERLAGAWTVSLLLATPLTVLGVYCILPLPSYDCDCCFAVLVAILLLQRLTPDAGCQATIEGARGLLLPFTAGVAVVVPLFFKQNIGLALLAGTVVAILLLIGAGLSRRARMSSKMRIMGMSSGHEPEMPPSGAKEAAEKLENSGDIGKVAFAGAKALFILMALSARLKSCPVTEPSRESFSAACKARVDLDGLVARLKSCPDTPCLSEVALPQPVSPLLTVVAGVVAALAVAGLLLQCTVGVGNYVHWTIQFAAQRRLPGFSEMLGIYREPSLVWMLPCVAAGLLLKRNGGLRAGPTGQQFMGESGPRVPPGAIFNFSLRERRPRDTGSFTHSRVGNAGGRPLHIRLAKSLWVRLLALVLLAVPFLWPVFTLFLSDDSDDRTTSLLALWPLLLIFSAALTLFYVIRGPIHRALLPLVLLAAIHGTLLSQQLWGSTYAIWPLLILLVAEMIAFLGSARLADVPSPTVVVALRCLDPGLKASPFGPIFRGLKPPAPSGITIYNRRTRSLAPWLAGVIAATLLVCGGFYMASEERLSYVRLPDGPMEHSTFPELAGMATPGPYLPNFDELLRFAAANIPASDGLILLPGEDPFYFATGRVPQFPVLLFDPATDPYSPSQIVELARARNIRWLVVKRELQIEEDVTPQRAALMGALLGEFTLSNRLKGYDVYRRFRSEALVW